MTITPFRSNVDQSVLDDLRSRIEKTRWPDEIENAEWTLGANVSYLKKITSYWAKEFNWRKVEDEINSFPNFIAEIEGYKIHFVHIKGKHKNSIPLIMTHGWPGSFLEMFKIAPMLTNDASFSFDLVIPSVIGFGFSDQITRPGCNSLFIAGIWQKLMMQLGYEKFGVQGGDIGAGIGTWLALKYPRQVTGLHLNYIPGSFKPYPDKSQTQSDISDFEKETIDWYEREGAYNHLQSTKPSTLAHALNDSPVGLAAWILEKFSGWSDHNGNIESVFSRDELLANVTLYWISQTIYSSMRIYYENRKAPIHFGKDDFVKAPVGVAHFPRELPIPPRAYVEKGYNVTHWHNMPVGGHFAAMEQPKLLADDIINFFSTLH